MQVGQPIEDLFRYNAERGLLGDGPIEEAIQRRLNHLRSGKAHIRESEKEDGTVLEIRGNSCQRVASSPATPTSPATKTPHANYVYSLTHSNTVSPSALAT